MKVLNKKFEGVILGAALLLALVLRTYNFPGLSFFHDELSALTRTQFNSLSDLFSQGILIDGHPPLIQVFLYFWTGLFGYNEMVVKLPFLIVGMLSLYMLYKMTKAMTNSWIVALGVLLFFATNQLHISYSTIARMYITGFFFSVSLVYFWWKWLQNAQKRDFILMLVFAILGAYNHHFNLLFCVFVWASGWFYSLPEQKKQYWKALLIVFIAYLPSVYITYFQLVDTQGLSWMTAPSQHFIFDFTQYVFHFRGFFALVVLAGIALSLIAQPRTRSVVILGLGWFISCFTIAYLYSIHIAPVIQYHLMLFALPFPIIASLVGWEKFLKEQKFQLLIGFVLLANLYTLVAERKHFEYFNKQPYRTLATEVIKLAPKKTLVVSGLTMKYLDFYLKDYYTQVDTLALDSLYTKSFEEINNTYDYVITCGTSEALETYFTPYFQSSKPSIQGFGYEIDVLEKRPITRQNKTEISTLDFKKTSKFWTVKPTNITLVDTDSIYVKDETEIWGPNFEKPIDHSFQSGLLYFDVDYVGGKEIGEQFLVINFLDESGKEISNNIYPFEIELEEKGTKTIRAIYDLDILPAEAVTIKAFHWKRSKTILSIQSMRFYTSEKETPQSYLTDSLVSVRDYNLREQENWSTLPYAPVLFESETGHQYFDFKESQSWFPTYTFDYDYTYVYAMEFEFMAEEIHPLSSIIIDIKDENDNTVYWSEKKLNGFAKSSTGNWSKASISIPYAQIRRDNQSPLTIIFSNYKAAGPSLKIKNPLIRKFKPNPAVYGFIGEITE